MGATEINGIKERKKKNGKIVYDVRVQYDGIRISRTVPNSKSKALRVYNSLLSDLVNGKYEYLEKKKNPQFKHYAKQYIETVRWQKSFRLTVIHVKHLTQYFGETRLSKISQQDFLNYRSLRLAQVGHATCNREYACLNRILNLAVNDESFLIKINPLKGVKKLKEPPAENRILTKEEYHKLLENAPEYFARIIFFACNTGMRLMEILNLKFGHIKLHINGAEAVLFETKSGRKEHVPLSKDIKHLILEIADQFEINMKRMREGDKEKYIFTGKRGQRIKSVRKPMERTFKAAGIERRPFHTFRHFWTKMMFESGVDPSTIQKIGR